MVGIRSDIESEEQAANMVNDGCVYEGEMSESTRNSFIISVLRSTNGAQQ